MSGPRQPWWYSGDEPTDGPGGGSGDEPIEARDDASAPASDEAGSAQSVDWGQLLAGAFRMVDWATSSVMAPHAEHADPVEHPQCVVCRGILLMGAQQGAGGPAAAEPAPERASTSITWIPIKDPSRSR